MRHELVEGRTTVLRQAHLAVLSVMGGLVLLVANGLELEGAVGHIEMSAEAFAEPVQHFARATLADARVIDDDVRG